MTESRRHPVTPGGERRDQPDPAEPGGGAVLQQARDGGAVDQRRQAGGEDDAAELSSVSIQQGAALAERDCLQSGESVATFGAAAADWELVADEPAAATGEDGRSAGEAYSLLLATLGREPSDQATLRGHGTADRLAVHANGVSEPPTEQISATREVGEGEVSEELVGKAAVRALGLSGEVKLTPSVARGSTEHGKLDWTLDSEAVRRTLPVGRKWIMEIRAPG